MRRTPASHTRTGASPLSLVSRISAVGLAAAILSACSVASIDPRQKGDCLQGYVDDALLQEELARQAPCCGSLDRLPFEALNKYERNPAEKNQTLAPVGTPPGYEPVDLWIARSDPVYPFAQGKSRFAAFDLRGFDKLPKAVILFPQAFGQFTTGTGCSDVRTNSARRYFRPIITLLDGERKVIRAGDSGQPIDPVVSAGLRFELPSETRFIVIHADPAQLGRRFYLPGGQSTVTLPVPGSTLLLPQEVDGTVDGVAASTGWLRMAFLLVSQRADL